MLSVGIIRKCWKITSAQCTTCVWLTHAWLHLIQSLQNPDLARWTGRRIHNSDERLLYFSHLLTELQLHQGRAFVSCNRCVNCTSKKMYVCYFDASSKWMDVNPWSRDTAVLLLGTSQWWRGLISVYSHMLDWLVFWKETLSLTKLHSLNLQNRSLYQALF